MSIFVSINFNICFGAQKNRLTETVLLSTHNIWASTQENLSSGFATNKGADQPAHPCRLISVFVIRFLKSIISKLASRKISIF